MEIEFRAYGNKKQVDAFRAWIDPNIFDIVYGGSKGCTTNSTKITCIDGEKSISDIKEGDLVLTLNENNKNTEWKPVLKTFKYHSGQVSEYHKLITFVLNDGNIISFTPNHELYIDGSWLPAGEFAGRILEGNRRSLRILHLDARESAINTEIFSEKVHHFKAFDEPVWLSRSWIPDAEEQEENLQNKQISCYSFRPKPRGKADGEPRRFRPSEQSLYESYMDDCQRECEALFTQESGSELERRGASICKHNKRTGSRDIEEIQAICLHEEDDSRGIRDVSIIREGFDFGTELSECDIVEVRYELMQGYVYDIHVQDNHNYCATENNYIVHNSGKSYLGCALICGDALLYPGTNYFIARKTLSDLRKYTTSSIAEVLGHWGVSPKTWKYNGQDNFYQFQNGSKIYFLGCEPRPSDPLYARFGSIQMTRGMLEEGSEIEEAAKNALSATIGRWKNKEYNLPGKLIITCNPAKNWLYSEYYLPNKENQLDSHRRFIQALPSDNKMLPPGYLEHLERTLNYNEKQRLLYGNWEYDDDPSVLIDYEAILDVFKNYSVDHGSRYITADIARLGGAKIVAITWDGYRGHVHSWERMRLNFSLKKMQEMERQHGVSVKEVLVDGDGIGAALDDFGSYQSFRNNFPAFPSLDKKKRRDNNGQLVKENFDNRKSQMGFYTADLINDRKLLLTCEDPDDKKLIIQELEQVKQKVIGTDLKKGLVPKEEIMKTLGRSPDFWDAILMRKAFDYMKGSIKIINRNGNDNRNALVYGEGRRYEKQRHL